MPPTRDPLNAFLDTPQVPVSHAESGPLSGLALAVKDIFDVAGLVTGCGNPDHAEEDGPAARTAPSVQALLDAGARFVGKTQTEELAFSLIGRNRHFPFPINPKAPDRVTGGSSSGSAAAVAGGLADIALGSDTGGSIRAPASFCGLIGLRTTQGAIPLDGTMPLAPSLDTFGWFARDVETYEKVAAVLLGDNDPAAPNDQDPLSVPGSALATSPQLREGRGRASSLAPVLAPGTGERWHAKRDGEGGIRPLALPALDALLLGPDERTEYARLSAVVAATLGAPSTLASPPVSIDDLYWCFRRTQAREAWAAHGAWITARPRRLAPDIRERFAYGETISPGDALEEDKRRTLFRAWLADRLGDDGVLVLPTVPGAAPMANDTPDALQSYREQALRLLCWSSLTGFPQITIPLGAVHGAPFGISLLGPAGSDLALIGLAKRILDAEKA